MDLSPKLLTDVQFREQWRGYSPDEVDEFLERVAAGVGELQRRLSEAIERASAAEHRLLERSDEDEIRRTLVLAQRTAVASIEEARAEADRLVTEAEARCRQLVAEAEAEAARLDADIATRRRVELGDLADERAALLTDVENLRGFVARERERLALALRAQVEWLESGYSLAELPPLSDVDAPAPAAPEPAPEAARIVTPAPEPEPAPEPVVDLAEVDDDEADLAPSTSAVDELRLAREELADALRRAGVDADDPLSEVVAVEPGEVDDDAPLQLEPQLPRPAGAGEPAGEPTGVYDLTADLDDEPDSGGAAADAEALLWRDEIDDADDEGDPFLAELRRAVVDTSPLGPRDDDVLPPPTPRPVDEDRGGEEPPGAGFFRRGRRRG